MAPVRPSPPSRGSLARGTRRRTKLLTTAPPSPVTEPCGAPAAGVVGLARRGGRPLPPLPAAPPGGTGAARARRHGALSQARAARRTTGGPASRAGPRPPARGEAAGKRRRAGGSAGGGGGLGGPGGLRRAGLAGSLGSRVAKKWRPAPGRGPPTVAGSRADRGCALARLEPRHPRLRVVPGRWRAA